ncbi:MAG TPA: hypothetical protein ENH10_04165 [Bacteroidetes bacterium]|nr:hypothetical protein BMS3Bbin04_00629 [bacterium BMS3Bbin04]HDO65214.1 hypothetical protein [Bacteroidota bacterium]HEX04339.1 hypothetical protein [Bacteroidota bacterium]
MIILDMVAAVDPWAAYALGHRLVVAAVFLLLFLVIGLLDDWLDFSLWISIFRVRPAFVLYLSLRSRLMLTPLIVAFLFIVPSGAELDLAPLKLRATIATILIIVALILGLILALRDTERF